MHVLLATLFFFAILTLWVPGYWPVMAFQVGVFALAATAVWRARLTPPRFVWPLVPLTFAVLWGVFQLLEGRTAYPFETRLAILRWATFLSVFVVGLSIFRDEAVRRWFRSAIVWFAFLTAILATVQTFTSKGKVFWVFATPYSDGVMGPVLYRNHWAAFIEAALPIAIYLAMTRSRNSLLYAGMAATMYASVIASASRAGSVLATAEFVLVPLLLWGRRRVAGRDVANALLRVGVLFVAFTAVVGWTSVWNRFLEPDPMEVRRELNIASVHMATAHPWFGTGLGTWSTVYPQYAVIDVGAFANQAHNDWLQWSVEGGFPFAIALATLFFWSLRPALRSIWGVGVIAVFLHAIVDYPFARPALGSWTIVLMSMMAVTAARSSQTESPPLSSPEQ